MKKKNKKDEDEVLKQETIDLQVIELIEKMRMALEQDKLSNRQSKPAFERLKMLKFIDIILQKFDVCETFLEKDGLTILAEWLEQMPDQTFPNQKIVMTILNCLDRLVLDDRHIDKDISGELQ